MNINIQSFKESFSKKVTATKVEIKYDSIISITHEENDENILINYKRIGGLPSNLSFRFTDPTDYDIFFKFMGKEKSFTKIYETLTPFDAIIGHFIGLIATIAFTIISYNTAIENANGAIELDPSGKERLLHYLFKIYIYLLGDKGVLAVGFILAVYLIFKISKRIKNLPNKIKYLPPNS